jgi:transcriptional regulator with XRE-family HTH domain
MGKYEIKNKISKLIVNEPSNWMAQVEYYEKNKAWLDKSAEIAVRILSALRKLSLSQKDLAEMTGVSPQYINKVVKGQENLSLETICKIERALGVNLVEVPVFEDTQVISQVEEPFSVSYTDMAKNFLIYSGKVSYNLNSVFRINENNFNTEI